MAAGMYASGMRKLLACAVGLWAVCGGELLGAEASAEEMLYEALAMPDETAEQQLAKFESMKKAADAGDPHADFLVGMFYRDGKGVAANDTLAFECFERATKKAILGSWFALGRCYFEGSGVEKDLKAAHECYLRGAYEGDSDAYVELVTDYLHARGTEPSLRMALSWWEVLEKESPKKLEGLSFVVSLFETIQKQNVDKGSARAMANLGYMYYLGFFSERNQQEGRDLIEKAAAAGDAEGQLLIGILESASGNAAKAAEYFAKAAEQGLDEAQFNLAVFYERGRGVAQDTGAALKLYEAAAAQGHAKSLCNLAMLCRTGKLGVQKDEALATELFEMAANKGDEMALTMLGCMLQDGQGVEQNRERAVDCFAVASQKGDCIAQFNFALCLLKGDGCPPNEKMGFYWLQKAAQQGMPQAQELLAELEAHEAKENE